MRDAQRVRIDAAWILVVRLRSGRTAPDTPQYFLLSPPAPSVHVPLRRPDSASSTHIFGSFHRSRDLTQARDVSWPWCIIIKARSTPFWASAVRAECVFHPISLCAHARACYLLFSFRTASGASEPAATATPLRLSIHDDKRSNRSTQLEVKPPCGSERCLLTEHGAAAQDRNSTRMANCVVQAMRNRQSQGRCGPSAAAARNRNGIRRIEYRSGQGPNRPTRT